MTCHIEGHQLDALLQGMRAIEEAVRELKPKPEAPLSPRDPLKPYRETLATDAYGLLCWAVHPGQGEEDFLRAVAEVLRLAWVWREAALTIHKEAGRRFKIDEPSPPGSVAELVRELAKMLEQQGAVPP